MIQLIYFLHLTKDKNHVHHNEQITLMHDLINFRIHIFKMKLDVLIILLL
jgi:hypothetical protein